MGAVVADGQRIRVDREGEQWQGVHGEELSLRLWRWRGAALQAAWAQGRCHDHRPRGHPARRGRHRQVPRRQRPGRCGRGRHHLHVVQWRCGDVLHLRGAEPRRAPRRLQRQQQAAVLDHQELVELVVGEKGYIRIEKGTNQCLVAQLASSAVVGGPVPRPRPRPRQQQQQQRPHLAHRQASRRRFAAVMIAPTTVQRLSTTRTRASGWALGSMVATCGAGVLELKAYMQNEQCTGTPERLSLPLDKCLASLSVSATYHCN
ncbi:hypothetical protein ERJ75_000310300 [Trypanosoma vivax]|nr:hypothetical protein ERJ75_000310300 [Trypanosoma vivax]